MKLKIVFATLLAGGLLSLADAAHAICVACSCTVTPNAMSFGSFAPLSGANVDAVANIDVACTGVSALDAYTLRMGAGQNGTIGARKLRSGANLLSYNVFSDAARTSIWGDGAGGYGAVTITNNLGLLSWNSSTPAYGRASPTASTPPGAYSDVVVVTVEW